MTDLTDPRSVDAAPLRLEVIRDLPATGTIHPMSVSLALVEMGLRTTAVLPGPVRTPILADLEQSMGKDDLDGGVSGGILTGVLPAPEI